MCIVGHLIGPCFSTARVCHVVAPYSIYTYTIKHLIACLDFEIMIKFMAILW